jgi:hypothetical protein
MELTLAEELLLIALDSKRGKLITSSDYSIDYCISGAILFDLTFENKISLNDKMIQVINDIPHQDDILNRALSIIANNKNAENIQFWINELCERIPSLRNELLENLVKKDILYKVEKKLLKIFSSPRYLPKQGESEHLVRSRIRDIILNHKSYDFRSIMLIGLVNTADLVEEVFPALNDLKAARNWINSIAESNKIHSSIAETLEEIQSAVESSISVPIIART